MKKIFFSIVLLLVAASSFAQRATQTQTHTKNKSISTSVSISNSDEAYKLSASFDRDVSQSLLKLINERLNQSARISGPVSSWSSGHVYSIILKENKLNIWLDKQEASAKLVKTFEKMGADAQQIIDGKNTKGQD